ncbi:aldehyde dehydrogenase family protein, partial [Staphylococcus epidermidis]|uniref:aldehyde dehydrogenase family protein n=1 Tax=Staphylococcus epidermidis TaxID=1282 RepID=UPI0011A40D44
HAFHSSTKISKQQPPHYLLQITPPIHDKTQHLPTLQSLQNPKPYPQTSTIHLPQPPNQFKYFPTLLTTHQPSLNQIHQNTITLLLNQPLALLPPVLPWNFPI